MITEFDKKLEAHPLYTLAKKVGIYRSRPPLKSPEALDMELSKIAAAIEKNKDKLSAEQTAVYEQALEEIKKGKSETQAKPKTKPKEERATEVKTPEAPKVESTASAKPQKEDDFYLIFKLLYEKGMLKEKMAQKFEGYKKDDPDFGRNVSRDFRAMLRHNSDEENKKIEELLKGNKKLTRKFKNALESKSQKKAERNTAPKAKTENTTNPMKKKGENKMADTDFLANLTDNNTYKLAKELGIDVSGYNPTNKEDFDKALAEIKTAVKKHQQEKTEEQKQEEFDKLNKDHPELADEYKKIEQEDKPRETLNVENKEQEPEENTPELSWMEAKKKFWKEYAEEKSLTPDFNVPEGETAPVYCSLSKDGKEEGVIAYTSKKNAQISKESSLALYQGLVKDAVQNNLSITFGATLDDRQKLMLYAAVLLSEDKYEGTNEKAQAVNPPALTKELINSVELPLEAKEALMAEMVRREQEAAREAAENTAPENGAPEPAAEAPEAPAAQEETEAAPTNTNDGTENTAPENNTPEQGAEAPEAPAAQEETEAAPANTEEGAENAATENSAPEPAAEATEAPSAQEETEEAPANTNDGTENTAPENGAPEQSAEAAAAQEETEEASANAAEGTENTAPENGAPEQGAEAPEAPVAQEKPETAPANTEEGAENATPKNYASEQEGSTLVQERLASVRSKLKKDDTENNLSTDERYALRKEQVDLMRAQLTPEQLAARLARGRK